MLRLADHHLEPVHEGLDQIHDESADAVSADDGTMPFDQVDEDFREHNHEPKHQGQDRERQRPITDRHGNLWRNRRIAHKTPTEYRKQM